MILEKARGTWIQYLDADDYLLPDKVFCQLAETHGFANVDVIYSPVLLEYWDLGDRPLPLLKTTIDLSMDIYAQWLGWQLPQTGGALWNRVSLERLGGWKPQRDLICDEHELYMRALQAGSCFQFAPTASSVYRIWSNQTRAHREPQTLILRKSELIGKMRIWLLQRAIWKDPHERIAGQACFEMCRTLARYDLRAANRLLKHFENLELIRLSGPAAPLRYQRAYNALGFVGAELVARWSRRLPGR